MLFRGAASSLLTEAGYRQRTDRKDLTLVDEANGVEFFYLRPRDIAVYVGEGALDIGITGRDLLLDSKACLLYTSPSPRDRTRSRMPSSA